MKFSLLIALALVSLTSFEKIQARRFPSPSITEIQPELVSPGEEIIISGSGFIKNFASAHKLVLKQGKKKFKLQILSSNANSLTALAPGDLSFGDYELAIKIKTRLLKSRLARAKQRLRIRPKAPAAPQLKFQIIKEPEEIDKIFVENNEFEHHFTDLKLGINSVSNYYTQDGFQSKTSEPSYFYYLPESEISPELELTQEDPISSFAKKISGDEKFDISSHTLEEKNQLEKSFFVKTPNDAKYLEHRVKLTPIIISEIHAKEPESITLLNQSLQSFDLINCKVYDSLKQRHIFEEELIVEAGESFQLSKNLGINDDGDDMKLECSSFSTSLGF